MVEVVGSVRVIVCVVCVVVTVSQVTCKQLEGNRLNMYPLAAGHRILGPTTVNRSFRTRDNVLGKVNTEEPTSVCCLPCKPEQETLHLDVRLVPRHVTAAFFLSQRYNCHCHSKTQEQRDYWKWFCRITANLTLCLGILRVPAVVDAPASILTGRQEALVT